MDTITDFRKLLASNSTDTTFATRGNLLAAPTTVNRPGLISTSNYCNEGQSPRGFEFAFFGASTAADTTIGVKINRLVKVHSSNAHEYVELTHCYLTVTRSATFGSSDAGATVSTGSRWCDTIAVTKGNANTSVEAISIENDNIASAFVDARNVRHLEVLFSSTTGADANCMFRPVYEP